MRTRSITRRALAIVLLVQTGFALSLGSETVWHEWHGRIHALDVQIAGHNDSLLGAIQDAEDPEDIILVDPEELRLPREDRYAVYSDTGKLIGASSGALLPKDGLPGIHTMAMDGTQYRVLRRHALRMIDRKENGGVGLRRPLVMIYAAPMTHVLHETIEGVGFTLISIALAAVISGFLATWLLRGTLRPIYDLAIAAQRVSPGSLHFEPPPSAMQVQELQPLATALTVLIAELREAFAKEQRFISDAAHELKTAVAVVRSTVQVLMLRRRSEGEYAAGLERILEDNSRVEAILSSMLDLARFEQSSVDDPATIDLNEAVTAACRAMRSVAEAKGVNLETTLAASARVRFHADSAETLLTNLLSNSIRHSDQGSSIHVNTSEKADFVSLEVVDQGSGISPESLPHVFERFYRDDPSRSRISGGTGLGLAICKSIVSAADGSIAIESTPNQETKVTALFRKA